MESLEDKNTIYKIKNSLGEVSRSRCVIYNMLYIIYMAFIYDI